MKRLVFLFALCLLFAIPAQADEPERLARLNLGIAGSVVTGAPAKTWLFHESFDGATEDNTWSAPPEGWDLDCTTSPAPLEGAQSTCIDTLETTALVASFTGGAVSVIYARLKFTTITTTIESAASGIQILLYDSSDNIVATAYLFWHTGGYYRIYAGDGSVTGNTSFGSDYLFNDAVYILEVVYTQDTSVVATVRSADGTSLFSKSIATTQTADAAKVGFVSKNYIDSVIDEVEVRTDTNWGT